MTRNVRVKFICKLFNHQRALTAVVVDIRVIGVVFDGLLEALECLLWVALLHVDAGNFDQALSERRDKFDGDE